MSNVKCVGPVVFVLPPLVALLLLLLPAMVWRWAWEPARCKGYCEMFPKEEWEREEERGEDVKRGDWGLEEVDRAVRSGEEG